MTKLEFLTALRAHLWRLPPEDVQKSLDYYSEMIDDRMEEGLTEAEAVADIGDPEAIAKEILEESRTVPPETAAPASVPVSQEGPTKPKKARVWEIVLLILGAPLWIPLLIAAAAVIFAVLISLWAIVGVLFCVALSLGASAVGLLLGCIPVLLAGRFVEAVVILGASLVCAGLCILFVHIANLTLKGMTWLSRATFRGIGKLFRRKEHAA